MTSRRLHMKTVALLLAAIGLTGCIAVPVAEPYGAYIGVPAPAIVVQPRFGGYYYGYRDGHRGDYRRGDRHRWR
jgi:hypothetical protein